MNAAPMASSSERRRTPRQSGPRPEIAVEGERETIVAVQLISQTSHLTLSTSRNDAKPSGVGVPSPCQIPDRGDSLTLSMSVVPVAQPLLEIEALPPQGRPQCLEEGEREEIMEQTMEFFATGAASHITDDIQGQSSSQDAMPCLGEDSSKESDSVENDAEAPRVFTMSRHVDASQLYDLPTEVLLQILGYLDVCDLLATSRTSHLLRHLSLAPILHHLRLRRTRAILPPMLASPSRPSLADLIRRSIFLTNTTVVSRKLARSLVTIRLSRRLAARPSAEVLVERCVLPPECIPGKGIDGSGMVAPALVARKRAVERERVKDGLRRWIGSVWRGEVQHREEGVKKWEERVGVGRVWRLRRFWEGIGTVGDYGRSTA